MHRRFALCSKDGAIHGAGVGIEGQLHSCHWRAHAHFGGRRVELPRTVSADEAG